MWVVEDTGSESCTDFQGRLGAGCRSLLAKTAQNWEAVMQDMFAQFVG